MQGLSNSEHVDHSEHLQDIERDWLPHEEAGHGGNHVEGKLPGQIVKGDVLQRWLGAGSFEEV